MKRLWFFLLAFAVTGSVTAAPAYGPTHLDAEPALSAITSDAVPPETNQSYYKYGRTLTGGETATGSAGGGITRALIRSATAS